MTFREQYLDRFLAVPRRSALLAFLVVAVSALLILTVFRPGEQSAAAVSLGDPNAWIEHGIDGELLQINSATGEVTSRIEVAEPGESFVAVPSNDGAVVLNTSTTVVSVVSGSTLEVSSTIDLDLAEGATDRDIGLFVRPENSFDVIVVDVDQVLHIETSSGEIIDTPLETPLTTAVQGGSGEVYALDRERSTVVRLTSGFAAPVAEVNEVGINDTDQRQIVSTAGRIFALDPARLSLAELQIEGELGDSSCLRGAADGAVHGGSGLNGAATVLSLNVEAGVLAVSTGNGGCRDVDVAVDRGEYGPPPVSYTHLTLPTKA